MSSRGTWLDVFVWRSKQLGVISLVAPLADWTGRTRKGRSEQGHTLDMSAFWSAAVRCAPDSQDRQNPASSVPAVQVDAGASSLQTHPSTPGRHLLSTGPPSRTQTNVLLRWHTLFWVQICRHTCPHLPPCLGHNCGAAGCAGPRPRPPLPPDACWTGSSPVAPARRSGCGRRGTSGACECRAARARAARCSGPGPAQDGCRAVWHG